VNRADQLLAGQGHNPLLIQWPGICPMPWCVSAGLTLLVPLATLAIWLVGVCSSSCAHLPRSCGATYHRRTL